MSSLLGHTMLGQKIKGSECVTLQYTTGREEIKQPGVLPRSTCGWMRTSLYCLLSSLLLEAG